MSPTLPTSFGRYRVQSLLGQGGTGIVYRAEDPSSLEPLVIKTTSGAMAAERAVLEREIAALTRLTRNARRGIVRLLDSGCENGAPWYAMQFVAGQSLESYRRSLWDAWGARESRRAPAGAGELTAVIELGLELAECLRGMHGDGVVHGDVTPANVLFDAEGKPVLVDFGTAFQLYEPEFSREIVQVSERRVGTPGYMAPEQIRGEPLDPRTDVYALGCILYELVTGRPPFHAESVASLLQQHLSLEPRAPVDLVEGLDRELDTLLLSMLAKQPQRRPSRAEDVLLELGRRARTLPSTSIPAPGPGLYRPRLVGRAQELAELDELLARARGGRGGLVMLSGTSGTGKTRLLNELYRHASSAGFKIVGLSAAAAGQGDSGSAGLTIFGPALWAVAQAAHDADSGDESLREALAILSAYAPQASGLPGALHRPRHVPSQDDVIRSLGQLLQHLCRSGPALVTIDDLQWADELSLRFLHAGTSFLAGTPLLLVGTYRSDEIGERLELLEACAERTLHLERLDLAHVYAMTRDLLATEVAPEGLPEFLAEHADGNPFLVSEYLRAAIARGFVVRLADGKWAFDGGNGGGELPASLRELFSLRLERVSADARSVLELAAVLGREFEARELAALLREPSELGGVALEELIGQQILECTAPGRYRFAHDKLREAQELLLDGGRRRELHRLAALALEASPPAVLSTTERDARLGVHWREAGESSRALRYLRSAAEACQTLHAPARAAVLYKMALGECERCGAAADSPQIELAAELHEKLGDALLAQARHGEARAAYLAALERLDASSRLSRARSYRKLAASFWRAQLAADAREHLEQAARTLGAPSPADDTELQREHIEIQLGKFERLYFARDTSSAAQTLLDSLADVIDVHGSPGQRVRYYLCASSDAMARSRYAFSALALELARRALAVEPELLTLHERALSQFIVGFALMLGDAPARREALRHFEQAAQGAKLAADRMLRTRVAIYQAITWLRLGDAPNTEMASRHALELAETSKLPPYVAAALACSAWVQWRAGDHDAARASVAEAMRLWRAHPVNYPFRWCANFVLFALALNDEDAAGLATAATQLLDAMQQALPPELEGALRGTLDGLAAGQMRAAMAAAVQALTLGCEFGFC